MEENRAGGRECSLAGSSHLFATRYLAIRSSTRAHRAMRRLLRYVENQAELDRLVPVFAADAVDRRFGGGAFCGTAVDEIGRIGEVQIGEFGDTDAEKPVFGAVDFPGKQFHAGHEDAIGEA